MFLFLYKFEKKGKFEKDRPLRNFVFFNNLKTIETFELRVQIPSDWPKFLKDQEMKADVSFRIPNNDELHRKPKDYNPVDEVNVFQKR